MKKSPKIALGLTTVCCVAGVTAMLVTAPGGDAGLLVNFWRDVATMFGAVGTVATLVGLALTYFQLRNAKDAAASAVAAANQARVAFEDSIDAFATSNARRFLVEARQYADAMRWDLTVLRVGDFAESVAQVALNKTELDGWVDISKQARDWEATFRRIAASSLSFDDGLNRKWHKFTSLAATKLDARYKLMPRVGGDR